MRHVSWRYVNDKKLQLTPQIECTLQQLMRWQQLGNLPNLTSRTTTTHRIVIGEANLPTYQIPHAWLLLLVPVKFIFVSSVPAALPLGGK